MEMKGEVLDKMLAEMLAAKTYKEAKAIEKRYMKAFTEDDLIRAAMTFGRESELAQVVAYCKDLSDKEPMTIRKKLVKFKHKVRLHLYYHSTRAWYVAFIPAIIGLTLVAQATGIYDMVPYSFWNAASWYLVIANLVMAEAIAYWFQHVMHKVE